MLGGWYNLRGFWWYFSSLIIMVPVNVIKVFEFSENLVSLKVLAGVQEGPNYLLADPFIYVVFFH